MNYKTIEYLVDDGILTLRLNRPDKMNAFTLDMSDELTHAFYRASDDDDVRVIIVTGAGKAFCAGMDLSVAGNVFGLDETRKPTLAEMAEPDNMPGVRDSGGKVTLAIYDCKKPVIGAINGAAVGIGATMICAMDIRLASERARIGFVFGKIGIAPEGCSTWFLPRIVGMQQSLKWMMTGEIFDATEAYSGGLVYEVCAADELMSRAYEMARQIADNTAPVSSALIRQMMYRNSAAAHPVEA
ncbi:enoyl-CoA hydratase-related protein, partial [bacterium]|nr:enoyl-CoA hydratase-related protein [bacterium]